MSNTVDRLVRGGSYFDAKILRMYFRDGDVPVGRRWSSGFRFVVRKKP